MGVKLAALLGKLGI